MHAGAAFRRVQAEAGLCIGVVGNLGAAIGIQCRVGFARHDHGEAARHQQRAQPEAECQRVGLLRLVAEASAGVVASVGRVQYDHKARNGRSLRSSRCGCGGGGRLRCGQVQGCRQNRKQPELAA